MHIRKDVWPASAALIDLANLDQVSDGAARCTAVAICDEQLQPRRDFYQGQEVHFFYEFEVLGALDAPTGGLEIIDANGVVIHGKNGYQYNVPASKQVEPGTRLRFHQVIRLELGAGTYSYAITLASVDAELYAGYQRGSVAEHVFRPKICEHCRVRRAGTFTVGYHPNTKLLHHGLANLPGALRATVSKGNGEAKQRASQSQHNAGWLASARTIWRSRAATAVATPRPMPPAVSAVARAAAPTVFHVTHWKAGSQWIFEILRYCAPDKIVEPQVGETQFLHHPLQAGKIYPTVYVTKQQFDSVAKPEDSRRFVVIRDLRDTLISAYFSIKVSHTLQTWMHDYQRVALQSLSMEDGLIYLMDEWLTGCARIQLSWLDADELVLRYNDILEHDAEILERVLLDECQLGVSRERFREAVLANRFEKMSGGRERGNENISAHMRKGIAGDWRNYFTDRVKRAFKMRYGSLLVAAGDEQDLNW